MFPLLFPLTKKDAKNNKVIVLSGISMFLCSWIMFYLTAPSLIYPFFGMPGVTVLVFWALIALFKTINDPRNEGFPGIFYLDPSLFWVLILGGAFIGRAFLGSDLCNAEKYASLIGKIETREWTKDVQPKDERHMRLVSYKNALYIAEKAVAKAGVMSQFDLGNGSLQKVNGNLIYVIPFDFKSFGTWTSNDQVPGYMRVDGEDPEREAPYEKLADDKKLVYTPNAYLDKNLRRHLISRYPFYDFLEAHLELDEINDPWWIVPAYKLTAGWSGKKISEVMIINPTSGLITPWPVDKVPDWVDRIYPSSIINEYANLHGSLTGGWWNKVWSGSNITEAEDPILIYGSDNRLEWVSSMTSSSGRKDSLVGLLYTDSRNGKNVFYHTSGGGTDSAILAAVNSNQMVKFKHLSGTTPQIYNIYGAMTAVVPLLNDLGAFQGVAIAEVQNPQDVAVGVTASEALHNYQAMLFRRGQQIAVEKGSSITKLPGVIDRIRQDVSQNGSTYFFHLDGVPRMFSASSADNVKIALTQVGDEVEVEYVDSHEPTVPVKSFENFSLVIETTPLNQQLQTIVKGKNDEEAERKSEASAKEKLKGLNPEELGALKKLLNEKE